MALIEVEDSLLPQLGIAYSDRTQAAKVAGDHVSWFQQVASDPATRMDLLRLMKKKDPKLAIPELDAAQPVIDSIAALQKSMDERFAALDTKRQEEETKTTTQQAERAIDDGRAYLRRQGFDDALIAKTELLMQDRKIGSYQDAAVLMRAQEPQARPLDSTPWNGSDLGSAWFSPPVEGTADADAHKLLLKDPRAYAQNEVRRFFEERNRNRRAA